MDISAFYSVGSSVYDDGKVLKLGLAQLGFDSRKYVVPLNALARSIARKKGLQILDFEKMVNSLVRLIRAFCHILIETELFCCLLGTRL